MTDQAAAIADVLGGFTSLGPADVPDGVLDAFEQMRAESEQRHRERREAVGEGVLLEAREAPRSNEVRSGDALVVTTTAPLTLEQVDSLRATVLARFAAAGCELRDVIVLSGVTIAGVIGGEAPT